MSERIAAHANELRAILAAAAASVSSTASSSPPVADPRAWLSRLPTGVTLASIVASDARVRDRKRASLLSLAARAGDVFMLTSLLSAGARVDLHDDLFVTLLCSNPRVFATHDDGTLAAALRALSTAGCSLHESPYVSPATIACLRGGFSQCLSIMQAVDDAAEPSRKAKARAGGRDAVLARVARDLPLIVYEGGSTDAFKDAFVAGLEASGVLPELLLRVRDARESTLFTAARHMSLESLLALARAGARLYADEELYDRLVRSKVPYERVGSENGSSHSSASSSAPLSADARLAAYLRSLHDAGVREASEAGDKALPTCVEWGALECLKVMLDVIHPTASLAAQQHMPLSRRRNHRVSDSMDLLFVAIKCLRPTMCQYLMKERHFSTKRLAEGGLAPVLVPLWTQSRYAAADAIMNVCHTLEAAMEGYGDVRTDLDEAQTQILHAAAMLDAEERFDPEFTFNHLIMMLSTKERTRVLMHMCSAVGVYPLIPVAVVQNMLKKHADLRDWMQWIGNAANLRTWEDVLRRQGCPSAPSLSPLRTHPMDVHVGVQGGNVIHLRDLFRSGGDVASALQLATHVDVVFIPPAATPAPGASRTLRCWAWMRRLHAVHHRRQVLRRMAAAGWR